MKTDDKRERILAAAAAVFAERDFHRVQVSEVAERAGVGKGTLYLYFRTKDALHDVALRASLERLAVEIEEAADAEQPAVALRAPVLAILRFFWRRPHLLTVVQRYEQRNGRGQLGRHRGLRAIERVLARHRLGPGGASRRMSAAFLLGMARAAILTHGGEDRPEAVAGRIVELFLHGIDGPKAATVARRARATGLRRALPALVLATALGAAGCGGGSSAEGMQQAPAAVPAVAVTVAPVAVRDVERVVAVVGTLAANEQADLASEAEGQVMAIDADLGDRVTAGQVLARVRGDATAAKLREAEASLGKATADEARSHPLRAQGIIAEQEYQQVVTTLQVARARRDALRIELDHTIVRAPFDAAVAARLVSVGNYVRSGTVLFRLVQDDPLKFRGDVPEREVPHVAPGQEVRITVDAFRGETFTGRISRVGSAADAAARSLAFEVLVPNGDRRLRPGFFGHGDVVVRHDEHALAVPRTAVSTFAGVTKLFVVEGGVAHEREVTLGVDLGDGWVEVVAGVGRGAQVATSGLSKLADGTQVSVRADAPPGA